MSLIPLTLVERLPDVSDCVRCGLCLESCPTYSELRLEADSPRGRIAIMRAMAEGRLAADEHAIGHLELCLDCRACETACPSGVRYGTLIEAARMRLHELQTAEHGDRRRGGFARRMIEYVLFEVLPDRRRLRRWVGMYQMAEACGLVGFVEATGLVERLGMPRLPRLVDRGEEALKESYTATRQRVGAVALFVGCATEVLTPETNRSAVRVLNRNGLDVMRPAEQVCCGAIHHHAGRAAEAQALARENVEAFERVRGEIVVTAAGCGAMLKQYGELLADDPQFAERAKRIAERVRDVTEVLASHALQKPRALERAVAYHDACHLCHAQGVRREPREMLKAIPGLRLRPLEESEMCCGAAGTYSVLQPEMSARLAARKWARIRASGAEAVAAANVGCILQLRQHVPEDLAHVKVRHPVELLDEAYGEA